MFRTDSLMFVSLNKGDRSTPVLLRCSLSAASPRSACLRCNSTTSMLHGIVLQVPREMLPHQMTLMLVLGLLAIRYYFLSCRQQASILYRGGGIGQTAEFAGHFDSESGHFSVARLPVQLLWLFVGILTPSQTPDSFPNFLQHWCNALMKSWHLSS